MPKHLRAFLYDPTHGSGNQLVSGVFSSWSNGDAVAIIPCNFPKNIIENTIIRCDPSEVIDLTDGETKKRKLAIVDTPDLAAVVLTSGTTGNPKPVELGFMGMKNSVEAVYDYCELDSSDTWLCCIPPYFVGGLSIFARSFVSQSQLVFHEDFDIEKVDAALKNNLINAISLVPFQLEKLLEAEVVLTTLKTILVGGGPVSSDVIRKCGDLGIAIKTTYGMTETWGGICLDGNFLSNSQGRIANSEIEVSTTSLMLGYRHDYPSTIAKLTADHWFHTSDRGTIVDGKLKVYGRTDDVIISGGVKVDPIPLEALIHALFPQHEVVVIPTKHKKLGECSTVCFLKSDKNIPKLGEIRSALIEKVPSVQMPVRLATIQSFPRSDVGKLLRKEFASTCEVLEEHIEQ